LNPRTFSFVPFFIPKIWKRHRLSLVALLLVIAAATSGCSIKKIAVNKLGDSLASGGTTFTSDDDPDLVGEALPFSLKLMESLLAESPQHRGLLFATCSGFTEYAFVYVQVPAEEVEDQDLAKADFLRMRARHLYLRARNYGLRGLEVNHRGFASELRQDAKAAVSKAGVKDVPLLYWTAASWGAAISVSKDNPEMIADQPIVEALIDRALELNPDYDFGAIHGFLITYESVRRTANGDFAVRSRKHFERAVELTSGQSAAPYVALATTVSVSKQDSAEFESLLKKALAVDPDARPEWRLMNLVMQRRARWLLSREDELFVK
jgi:predicted anti-sigma-YlaC factor YlaD